MARFPLYILVAALTGWVTRHQQAALTYLVEQREVQRFVEIIVTHQKSIELRSGPGNLDSGLSEISIGFQAAVPKLVASKYTTSGVRRPSEL